MTKTLIPLQYFPELEQPRPRNAKLTLLVRDTEQIGTNRNGEETYKVVPRYEVELEPHEIVNVPSEAYERMLIEPTIASRFSSGAIKVLGPKAIGPERISDINIEVARKKIAETTDLSEVAAMSQHATTLELKELLQQRAKEIVSELQNLDFPALETPTAEQGLTHLEESEAIALVKKQTNRELLSSWRADPREAVIKAITAKENQLRRQEKKKQEEPGS